MLVPVPADQVEGWWDSVGPEIARALRRGGRYTVRSVKDGILERRMQLWLAVESGEVLCVCVTEILNYPVGRVGSVFICTGRNYGQWAHYMRDLTAWAKAEGCFRMEAWARPGWFRILKNIIKGLRMPHVHLEWDIA